jgi:U3 small nucleolar RNA-associated protein 10
MCLIPLTENILASNDYAQHLTSLLKKMQDADPYTSAMAHLVARALVARLSGERQIHAAGKMLDAMHLETLDGMEDIPDGNMDGGMACIRWSYIGNHLN